MAVATDDEAVALAIADSHLAGIPPALRAELLSDATRLSVPGGSVMRRAGDDGPHVELVVDGLVRIFVAAPEGRTLTVRYCRPGALLGVVSLFRREYVMPGSVQALVQSEVLVLRPAVVRRLATTHVEVAAALLEELSERVVTFVAEIPGSLFATVRQRLARHLLDLASERQRGPALLVRISQQDLAEAVGTAREVVVRILRDLREEGVVATGRDGIAILQPARLYGELFAPPLGAGASPAGPTPAGADRTGSRRPAAGPPTHSRP